MAFRSRFIMPWICERPSPSRYFMPKILFGVLQGWQNRPRVQGKKMQGMQNLVRDPVNIFARSEFRLCDSVCTFARYAMRQTDFRADFGPIVSTRRRYGRAT